MVTVDKLDPPFSPSSRGDVHLPLNKTRERERERERERAAFSSEKPRPETKMGNLSVLKSVRLSANMA